MRELYEADFHKAGIYGSGRVWAHAWDVSAHAVSKWSVAKKRYQAVGFPYKRMLKLSSSKGIRIDVPVLSVSWSVEDHSVNIQALKKGLIENEASDTGGVPRWKSSCTNRLAEATISGYFSELCWRSLAEGLGRCCRLQQLGRLSLIHI